MSIIKGTAPNGAIHTLIQPDGETLKAVRELQEKKFINIHDAETGEKY